MRHSPHIRGCFREVFCGAGSSRNSSLDCSRDNSPGGSPGGSPGSLTAKVKGEILLLGHDRRRQAAAALFLFFLAVLTLYLFCLPRDLFPDVPYSTVVEARGGELLGARTADDGQWRFRPSDTIPERYAVCLVQFEDRHFYTHHGINPAAIARAALQNIRSGRTISGGSTITMQVIRLSRAAGARTAMSRSAKGQGNSADIHPDAVQIPKRTLGEKIIEAFLAARLELRCTKEEILSLYASHAPFGGNVVGIEAASRRYFGRPASELSWADAATLAVLPNSPSLIHPGRNRDLLRSKRDRLLTRLYNIGIIDTVTFELACAEPLPERPQPLPQTAYHLVEKYHRTNPGETIRTGVDISLQNHLESTINRWNTEFSRVGIRDLAAVVIDVHTGETLAYCGNANISEASTLSSGFPDSTSAESYASVANHMSLREGALVDIADSPRSTGSVLKAFLYGAMLQNGDILPHTLIPDTPLNAGGFTPQNFDLQFSGAVSASDALARSLNVPYVRMLRDFGVQNFRELLQKAGMTTLTRSSEDYGLSLILGGAEGKLYEITKMYAAMSAHYQHITDWIPSEWPLTDHCALWWIFDTLKELNRPDEMDWRLVPSLHKIAWKTGTSYGFRDAWAVGVTPDYAVGVWAGNANGESASGLVGARTAGPVLFDIFNTLPASRWFEEPSREEYVYAEVCRKSGHLRGQFCEECDSIIVPAAGLRGNVCPYHKPVILTKDGAHRLTSPAQGCITRNFFILPPVMEWYYRRSHSDYIPLPPLLPGSPTTASSPLAFIYPEPGSAIFIPRALDGSEGEVVFSLAHTNPETEVFWHLDSDYVGSTRFVHSLSLRPSRGSHTITAVDVSGNSVSSNFTLEN